MRCGEGGRRLLPRCIHAPGSAAAPRARWAPSTHPRALRAPLGVRRRRGERAGQGCHRLQHWRAAEGLWAPRHVHQNRWARGGRKRPHCLPSLARARSAHVSWHTLTLLPGHTRADPYLNVDAGTMSPFEHGEVFVLDDGGEVWGGWGARWQQVAPQCGERGAGAAGGAPLAQHGAHPALPANSRRPTWTWATMSAFSTSPSLATTTSPPARFTRR